MITLSIVIVNYNVKEFLEQTLLSVIKSAMAATHEIIVVDNASSDGSVEMLRRKFPDVRLIANKTNRGFAAANNQGFAQTRGEFVLILNPDTVVQEDTVPTIIDFLRSHPDCGMVGCKILNPDGSLQLACRRSFPTPWVGFTRITGLSRLFPGSKFFGKYNLTYLDPDQTYEVEAISGSFMFERIASAILRGAIFWVFAIFMAMFVESSPWDSIFGSSTSISGKSEERRLPFRNALFRELVRRFLILCFMVDFLFQFIFV